MFSIFNFKNKSNNSTSNNINSQISSTSKDIEDEFSVDDPSPVKVSSIISTQEFDLGDINTGPLQPILNVSHNLSLL